MNSISNKYKFPVILDRAALKDCIKLIREKRKSKSKKGEKANKTSNHDAL